MHKSIHDSLESFEKIEGTPVNILKIVVVMWIVTILLFVPILLISNYAVKYDENKCENRGGEMITGYKRYYCSK